MAVSIPFFSKPTPDAELRRRDRHPVDSVRCQLGTLRDLSGGGMRVLCKAPPPVSLGQPIKLELTFRQGSIAVDAMVRWKRRAGLLRHEIGLQFSFPREDDRRAKKLEQLARFGFVVKEEHLAGPPPEAFRVDANLPDYYAVLGVPPGAGHDDLRSAYHRLCKRHHPDVGGDLETFMEVQRAWEVLQKSATRRTYDRSHRACA